MRDSPMHLDEGQLQRALHRELRASEALEVSQHLRECDSCRRQLAEARSDETKVFDLLKVLDHAPRPVDVHALMAPSAVAYRVPQMRWAAALFLAVGLAGVAFAMPGSPLRQWLSDVGARVSRQAPGRPLLAPKAAPVAADTMGVAVVPGGLLLVEFVSPQAEGSVRVRLTDDAVVELHTLRGVASFESSEGRLLVQNPGALASYDLLVPRSARRVEVRLGAERLFLKDGARIVTGTSADGADWYVISLRR